MLPYVISKNETKANVYFAQYPQPISEIINVKLVATLNFSYVVAADISVSGKEILIKTYINIFYWQRNLSDRQWQIFQAAPDTLPFQWSHREKAFAGLG